MTAREDLSDDLTYVVPPQLVVLGEALVPVIDAARQALARRVRTSGQLFVTLPDLKHHMGVLEHALSGLSARIDGLMTSVMSNKAASHVEVGRSVGRLEQVLSELVNGYLDTKASTAEPESKEARLLLLGVYRHHIGTLCDWLDNLVATIANPAVELRRRGIEPAEHVEITVPLNMSDPPEMAKLGLLIKTLQLRLAPPGESTLRPQQEIETPGILDTVGALVFGLGLSGAVFGKKHE